VFSGQYVTGVEPGYLEHLEQLRGDRKKAKKREDARHNLANGRVDKEDLKLLAGASGLQATSGFASPRPLPCGAERNFDAQPNGNLGGGDEHVDADGVAVNGVSTDFQDDGDDDTAAGAGHEQQERKVAYTQDPSVHNHHDD